MGNKISKSEKNKRLQEIGKKLSNDSQENFISSSVLNLTSSIFYGELKKNPEDDYEKLNIIKTDEFADVFRVKNKYTNALCSMKVKKKNPYFDESDDNIFNEIKILKAMDHPAILKVFDIYSGKDILTFVGELCNGGSLFDEIMNKGPFDEKYSAYVMFQLFSGLNYCHKMNVIHRDLTPQNINILDRNKNKFPRIKIINFHLSKFTEHREIQKKMVAYSSLYTAPEVFRRKYNEKSDIWSCGALMYTLLSGRPPFGGESEEEIQKNIKNGSFDLVSHPFDKLSESCLDLIKKLLELNADVRISAEDALNHPWFKENCSRALYTKIGDENIVMKLISNLKSYKSESLIQETALAYLIHNFPQLKDVSNACKLFYQIDTSGNGKIIQSELLKGLKFYIQPDNLEETVAEIFNNLDMDNSGVIEYEEFVRAAVSKEYFLQENILKFAFNFFDKDKTGEITFDEIENVFKECIIDKSQIHECLTKIIDKVDLNKDGIISFEEFSSIMKNLLKNTSK